MSALRDHRSGLSPISNVLLFVFCVSAQAQPPANIPHVGFLSASTASSFLDNTESFQRGLRENGYEPNKNIVIEYRFAEGNADHLGELANDLVRRKVSIIVTAGPQATRATKEATSVIPTVMAQDNDPVGAGYAMSLARPGGNITGLSQMGPDIVGKQLELLKEVVPHLSQVAVVANFTRPGTEGELKKLEAIARELNLQLHVLNVPVAMSVETAFRTARQERDGACLGLTNAALFSQRSRIAELAIKSRLPLMYSSHEWAEAGAVMSYGTNSGDLYRRVAIYVDKILKGAKPGDLPIQQPTKFDFLINLKTAKQIGLTIPPNVLARADRVIR
jgi:putative ABC transport system substrate-binding protein